MCLDRRVAGHRVVIVQVIARQLRKNCRVKAHRRDPALVERMRRHLHRDAFGAEVAQLRELALYVDCIGGCQI